MMDAVLNTSSCTYSVGYRFMKIYVDDYNIEKQFFDEHYRNFIDY